MKNSRRMLLIFLLTLVGSVSVFSTAPPERDYWPGETWRTSTPEEQGMDSEQIYRMLKLIQESQNTPHSVVIIRNGYLVTEAYFQPYHRDSKLNIQTCTKSFTSALIGIAIQKGLIKDVHQRVVDFFPEYSFANISEAKKAIAIENLLTMTAGFDWVWPKDDIYFRSMLMSEDSVQFLLDRRMTDEPGGKLYSF